MVSWIWINSEALRDWDFSNDNIRSQHSLDLGTAAGYLNDNHRDLALNKNLPFWSERIHSIVVKMEGR